VELLKRECGVRLRVEDDESHHQRRSEAIRGDQGRPEAAGGDQWPSIAIIIYQLPSVSHLRVEECEQCRQEHR
jgi:hypothetical protein